MYITIKELAEELGVSKPTISKAIDALGIQGNLRKVGNRFMLDETQVMAVKSQITQIYETEIEEKTQEKTPTELQKMQSETEKSLISLLETQISILQEQLSVKDNQIAAQSEQIKTLTESLHDTTAALTAAQALHAGTIQQQLTDKSDSSGANPENIMSKNETEQSKRSLWQRIFGKK
ncbi:MAG: HTH domain-containing protein [Ruminococcus sp.]|nr:HTH domain-containing protein [Ruminococcus sp.]MBR6669956.1 HTH domain-containing protein [Ruminococcus sp.]